jgi:hypothetical protein
MAIRRTLAYISLGVVSTFLASCGGGGGGSGLSFISWNGSANGSTVDGANGAQVQFRSDNRELYYQGVTYTNVTADSQARILFNGNVVGTVTLGTSTTNKQIAELICNNGNLMGIVGDNNTIDLVC